MNLPEISALHETQSTYITFSKSLVDFDRAIANGSECYFTKMVALNFPKWSNTELNSIFIDLAAELPEANLPASTDPNLIIPKMIQYYMENIIRNNIGVSSEISEITELAFWKMLHRMGLSSANTKNGVSFANMLLLSNYVETENNNGWAEIIGQIPNKCAKLTPVWKTVSGIKPTVQCSDSDAALYDNGLKQFIFDADFSKVLDFDNLILDETIESSSFDFNVLLLFYKDIDGKEKLHGVNFIYPFENKLTYYDLQTFTQKTNVNNTIGYQFKFLQKTCNNQATKIAVYDYQGQSFYNNFSEILSGLNSFLETKY